MPPLLALTGTASASVLRDMQHDLGIIGDEAVIRPKSFDRPEIIYNTVALCPNCHRKMHIINSREDKALLLEKARKHD